MKDFERRQAVNFDIVIMHNSEDRSTAVVRPGELSHPAYRYRANSALVLPAPVACWSHWLFADELAEFQLKNMPIRESMHGLIPHTLGGCAVARRALAILEEMHGEIFDETRGDGRLSFRAGSGGIRTQVALCECGLKRAR